MRATALSACLAAFFVTACGTTSPRITGHRLVYMKVVDRDENQTCEETVEQNGDETDEQRATVRIPCLKIALANTSVDTLTVERVSVIGVDNVSTASLKGTDWTPGEVRVLPIAKPFNCRIPIMVEVTYVPQSELRELVVEQVELKGAPTALPLSSLKECEPED